jgi:cytochrome c oxidase subunit 4
MADPHTAATAPTVVHTPGHGSVRTYVNVAIALAILTSVEVATLYIPGIQHVVLVISLLVMSAIKFFLVVGFFMHLRYDSPIMRALFVGPLVIAISIILALMALFSAYILLPRPGH